MGFGALRVINDDRIAPYSGFGAHSHRDMEIITLVTAGVLTHKDSMGNVGTVRAGEVQVMSAGSGVAHSEYNDEDEALTLFQIWITPHTLNVAPRYDQRSFPPAKGEQLLVGPLDSVRVPALGIHQSAFISRLTISGGESIEYRIKQKRNGAYFFVIQGDIEGSIKEIPRRYGVGLNVDTTGEKLSERDALGVSEAESITLAALKDSEVLVFDVPLNGTDIT